MDTKKSYFKWGLIVGGIGAAVAFIGSIPFLSCLVLPITCCGFFLFGGASGYMAAKEDNLKSDNMGEVVKIGAFSGLVTGTIRGLVSMIMSILVAVIFGTAVAFTTISGLEGDSSDAVAGTINIGFQIIAALISLVITIGLDGVFGIIGAIIFAAMNNDKK
ncbi:hypothetical protein KC909_03970 [Candidatus Dojkabacteria bacterium]|uniref:Uncharacterized protein n=1 Tax=Candidatus Dojkabacteria bacterium TaxID=2099670 RepID=A0A955L5P7_9BACT|nr:hypothetical protein [Candidatus Dojkabacteria bacterium]